MATILEIKKANAVNAYQNADAKGKKLLEDLIGKDILKPEKITDRIKTFNDVLDELGEGVTENVRLLLEYNGVDTDMVSAKAYMQIVLIARALNEGWTPDWTNTSQYKYVPWFKHKSGFGLSVGDCVSGNSFTLVGSRLCFKSRELAEYAAQQFADIYNDFLTIK